MLPILIIYCVLVALIGFSYCFWGYKHLRKLIAAVCFVTAALATYFVLSVLASFALLVNVLLALLAGMLAGALSFFVYKVALFILGLQFGVILSAILIALFSIARGGTLAIVITIVLSLLCALLILKLQRPLSIIFTSVAGAVLFLLFGGFLAFNYDGLQSLAQGAGLKTIANALIVYFMAHKAYFIPLTAAVGAGGMLIQFFVTAPKKR